MRGNPRALAFARGQKESGLIAAPITRVSNRATATFNYGAARLRPSVDFRRPVNPARTGCIFLVSVEVSAPRFNDVDVQVRNIDVTCAQALWRQLARIGAAAGVCDLIAAAMRQRESRVAAADGRQLG